MKNKKNYKYKEYEIKEKTSFVEDTFVYKINGKMSFSPGQFLQVALDRYGEGTFVPCSDPEDKKKFELCIRGCGNLSNQLINLLPGDNVKVRGPYGNGWPIAKLLGKNIILIAGGMGLVPIRPLLFELLRNKKEFKKIYLICGFKTEEHILFEEELKSLKNKVSYLKVFAERAGQNFWGEKGLITDALEKIKIDPKKTVALMCGPEVMVPFCNKILLDKKMPEKQIFISFERRMECGIGICQHCNIGKYLVCRDGPIFSLDKIKNEINK